MEIKTQYGDDIFCLPSCAWCKVAKRDIEDLDTCPLCNFDNYGDVCIPELCNEYTEDFTEVTNG